VLAAYRDLGWFGTSSARRGLNSLANAQNRDGGFGAGSSTASSVEETALAVEVLLGDVERQRETSAALAWLLDRVEDETVTEPSPIGFYFAKLWYFERLYPIIFSVAALRRACRHLPAEHRNVRGADLAGSVPCQPS
jgi:squalene-hopene/tetraprenyl-beta-curcumene cyclase